MRDIGKNIRDLRMQKNMTQEELAEQLFLTRQAVSSYETGRTRPDLDMLVKMAAVLDVQVDDVLYGRKSQCVSKPMLRRSCIATVLLILLLIGYQLLANKAYSLAESFNLFWLRGWLVYVYKPLICMLLGWTVMQIFGTFVNIPPVSATVRRTITIICATAITLYAALVLPTLVVGVDIPAWWRKTVYFVVGVLPGQHAVITWYLMAFAMVGAALWLTGKKRMK